MKRLIKKIIPEKYHDKIIKFKNDIFNSYAVKSYSQEGEDIILHRVFENKEKGFYVDIGAHHPKRFSNTQFFYKRGWQGINIDPMPGTIRLFNKDRPRDINLQCGISDSEGELFLYVFKDSALNTFSEDLANHYIEKGNIYIRKILIKVYPLVKILDEHLKDKRKIDFMSIDVEGFEMEVIKSNNWGKYRSTILVIESLDFDFLKLQDSEMYRFLSSINYKFFAKTINSLFFRTEA